MLTPGEGPQGSPTQNILQLWVALGGQTRKLFTEGESTTGLMEEWMSRPQGVPDVIRHPETGSSNAELEGLVVPDAHLFLSLGIPGSGKHTIPCYSHPLVFSPQKFLIRKRSWIGSQ